MKSDKEKNININKLASKYTNVNVNNINNNVMMNIFYKEIPLKQQLTQQLQFHGNIRDATVSRGQSRGNTSYNYNRAQSRETTRQKVTSGTLLSGTVETIQSRTSKRQGPRGNSRDDINFNINSTRDGFNMTKEGFNLSQNNNNLNST